MPLRKVRRAGWVVGRFIQAFDRKHREIVRESLRLAFPEKTEAWIMATSTACFEHLGMMICEMPYLLAAPLDELLKITRFHGLPLLEKAKAGKNGPFMLTGHIGNWEWCSLLIGARGYTGTIVVRPLDNPYIDRLVNQWRTRSGQEVMDKASGARRLLKKVKSGETAGILLDQNMDWYDGPWVDFFGRPACTNQGLALLAMATKAPVMPLYCFRAADGCFDVYVGEPIPLAQSGDRTNDVWQNTQNYTRALENIIRENPAQWLWMHRRWKTRNYCDWPREENR